MANPHVQPGAPAAPAAPVAGGPSGLVRVQLQGHMAEVSVRPDGTRFLTRWSPGGYARAAVQRWVDRHWGDAPAGPWVASVDRPEPGDASTP